MKTKITNLWRLILVSVFIFSFVVSYAADKKIQTGSGYTVEFTQAKSSEFNLNFELGDFEITQIEKNGIVYSYISHERFIRTDKKGWAELPFLTTAVELSALKDYDLTVTGGEYIDYDLDYPLLPSRGIIYRNQDPATIPYEIDPGSVVDEWYPGNLTDDLDPFIIRNVRGTRVIVYPFQYNAYKNTLRVYKTLEVRLTENDDTPTNPLYTNNTKVAREFHGLYKRFFVNYERFSNEIEEEYGEILVLYTSTYASAIQPWVTWKKEMGYTVHEQQVSTGTNVVSTIQSAYNSNNAILYAQLVGDWADIKTNTGGGASAPMDPLAGCVVGSDEYPEIYVGRFSASSTSHVTTQANKTITYEKEPESGGAWYTKGLGIGSEQGAGSGDDGEADYSHIDIIKENRLLPYTYTTVAEAYQNPSVSAATGPINAGLTVVNYCGHGSHSSWATTGYSTSNASSASNGDKLPICLSVACVVGEFHNGSDCLAEAMLKSTGGGAVGFLGSTINQSWQPPMVGQDYMNDLLIGGYNYSSNPGSGTSTSDELRTRFGPLTMNGKILMAGEVGTNNDYDTWTLFGDASLQIRTDQPDAITLSNTTVNTGTYSTQVTAGGAFEGALVSLYYSGNDQPFAGVTDASGNVTISHSIPSGTTAKLTVTGYNLDTYYEDVTVGGGTVPALALSYVSITGDYNTTYDCIDEGGTVTINVNATNNGGAASSSATVTCAATGTNASYVTVNTPSNSVGVLDPSETQASAHSVSVSSSLAAGSQIELTFNLSDGSYSSSPLVKTYTVGVDMSGYFTMDFEGLADFQIADFDPWILNDGDAGEVYGSTNYDFPNENGPYAFMAFNPASTTPTASGDAALQPHGGVRFGASMSATTNGNPPSNDWLISPKVQLGTNSSFDFWVKTYQDTWGLERYKVGVSTTNENPSSFTIISSGSYQEAPVAAWEHQTFDISAYDNQEVHLAINCVSNDAFIFMVDDISINTSSTNSDVVEDIREIVIYPNPSSGLFHIFLNSDESHITVFDLYGKVIAQDITNMESYELDMSSVAPGIYYVTIESDKETVTKRISVVK